MLGNKNRMSSHGRLLAVMQRVRRSNSCGDKVFGVAADNRFALFFEIGGLPGTEPEAGTKSLTGQSLKNIVVHDVFFHKILQHQLLRRR